MDYNKKFQAVPSLVLKVNGICVFLPKISFDASIFQWGKEKGELLLCTLPPFCQIFQRVIQQCWK